MPIFICYLHGDKTNQKIFENINNFDLFKAENGYSPLNLCRIKIKYDGSCKMRWKIMIMPGNF